MIIDDFKSRFPDFDSAQVDTYLPILEPVWPCYYGGTYEGCGVEIVLNLLAHMLVSETNASSSSVQRIQSKSVGSVSASYAAGVAATSERNEWLKTTKYGVRYMMLTRRRQGGIFV